MLRNLYLFESEIAPPIIQIIIKEIEFLINFSFLINL